MGYVHVHVFLEYSSIACMHVCTTPAHCTAADPPTNVMVERASTTSSPPTNVMAERASATSILVSWSPPDPLGDTTGYRIDYTDGSSSDSVTVDGGGTSERELTGLRNGAIYTISIVATSQSFPSESVVAMDAVHLGMSHRTCLWCM